MELTLKQLWDQVLDTLKEKLNSPTFETWIQTIIPVELQKNSLTIQAANTFTLNHL